jgi:hypothetical protein
MSVRDKIIAAFSLAPQPHAGNVSVPTYDDEETAAYFTGTPWQGHPTTDLHWHEASLSFFTPAAFRYYLPAFILAELDDPETADVIAEGILFHLTDGSRSDELLHEMNGEEREAVASFFEECARRYELNSFKAGADHMRRSVSG